jgi:Enolase C-terminal domain-like
MVDANGGYTTKQALRVAQQAAPSDVIWFEEPVSPDRLGELVLCRGLVTQEVTAGEYGTTLEYSQRMCAAGAADCLQVDASRYGGYTGLMAAAVVADAHGLEVSGARRRRASWPGPTHRAGAARRRHHGRLPVGSAPHAPVRRCAPFRPAGAERESGRRPACY